MKPGVEASPESHGLRACNLHMNPTLFPHVHLGGENPLLCSKPVTGHLDCLSLMKLSVLPLEFTQQESSLKKDSPFPEVYFTEPRSKLSTIRVQV